MIKPGEIQKFKVARKTDIGYMLTNKNQDEVFLHNNETNYKNLKEGMNVDAFLFYDNKGRLAATLYNPIITKDESAWLEVTGSNYEIGVFLHNGIKKDILLSKDHLPEHHSKWPKNGDMLYVKLVVKNLFTAEFTIPETSVMEEFESGSTVTARVYNYSNQGITLITNNFTRIFVEATQLRKEYRIGEEVEVIINFRHNEFYTGQLTLQKEEQRLDDAETILTYLKRRGQMNLTSDSSPEDIKRVFNMSKKAFKRALGALYKERLVDFVDGKTILVGEKNE